MADKQSEEITVQENKQLPDNELSEVSIKNLIYVVRGQQVMMDSDLAMLYQVETKVFNQAVKRNIERFPEKFRYQLTKEEYDSLRSQIVTSNGKGGRRYMPYVFTEQGIAMLSAVLRSDIAVQVSIKIMDSFVEMRRFLASNALMFERINEMEVIVYTVRRTRLSESDVNNFNQQYPTLEVKYTGVFHDRFLIIDDTCAYHIGASIKDAGKKCFGISLIEDTKIVKDILERLNLEAESE